jgi:hypothetical protein
MRIAELIKKLTDEWTCNREVRVRLITKDADGNVLNVRHFRATDVSLKTDGIVFLVAEEKHK